MFYIRNDDKLIKRRCEILGIPEGKRIVTGISIGYEDPSFAANAVISPRENIDDITEWFGL